MVHLYLFSSRLLLWPARSWTAWSPFVVDGADPTEMQWGWVMRDASREQFVLFCDRTPRIMSTEAFHYPFLGENTCPFKAELIATAVRILFNSMMVPIDRLNHRLVMLSRRDFAAPPMHFW